MSKITDKLMRRVAAAAENAAVEAAGFASHGGMYEPELTEGAKAVKEGKTSKIEALYDRLMKQ